jgi:hypothetical protein
MYSCPIANNLTYNFAGSPNGISPLPALNNVPYLYAFCFENGTRRSLVLINTDLSSSHAIGFSGTNPPQGTVTQRQYAPAALDDMNEAPTGTTTNLTPATVAIDTSTLSSPGSITLPPFSVTALDYTAAGSTTAAAPVFTPAAGSYTASQSVTISDATSGVTIYYTTNGSTPTTSSTVYSGPITVSATETLQAIAVETGYANSPVATATYTIAAAALPAPTFSPAPGSYTTAQSVTISDATAGATIYYTTNGTAPTTSSTVYSGPIAVSATETLQAIAVATGYTNSPVATAAYTIAAAALPAPTFSPAPGTYTSPQSVTISDATAGATIYYTTNGSTPTTSSTMYSGPITVSATETLQAIAVATGYTNSSVATAGYTIQSGFSISLAPTSLSLAAGQSATATVTVDPINGFNQTVAFGCTGLGAGLSCAFSPPSVTTGGTSATAILTVGANMNNSVSGSTQPLISITAAAFLFCAIGFRRRRRFHFMLLIAGLALVLTTQNACGGYVGTIPAPVTSTVTVTATSGTIQQTAALTVTVN